MPLRVPTVPIYIQEKVLPAALIPDLRRVSKGCEPQADLFGSFDRISDPECAWSSTSTPRTGRTG